MKTDRSLVTRSISGASQAKSEESPYQTVHDLELMGQTDKHKVKYGRKQKANHIRQKSLQRLLRYACVNVMRHGGTCSILVIETLMEVDHVRCQSESQYR